MPLKRSVKSLKELCIAVIIEDLDNYTTENLHNMPPQLSEDIIEYTNGMQCETYVAAVHRHNRFRFIQPNMKILNLPVQLGDLEYSDTIKMILKTSNTLTRLTCQDVESSPNFTEQDLLTLVSSIPNIVELHLFSEETSDDILKAIGDNCPALEILDLANCPVYDDAIHQLCESQTAGAKIKHLNLSNTRITTEGCLFALRNLKQMRELIWESNEDAFMRLFTNYDSKDLPTLQLSRVNIDLSRIRDGFFNFIMQLCPNLSNIELQLYNVNRDLSCLADIGSILTKLSLLETCSPISVYSIGLCCPNLRNLKLRNVLSWLENENTDESSVIPFKNLKRLYIGFIHSALPPIPIPQLIWVLQNCYELEKLVVKHHPNLTDAVVIDILHRVNPLRHLTYIKLQWCNNLTGDAILELLKMKNNLHWLKIEECFIELYHKDLIRDIESLIECNNYDILYIVNEARNF